MTGQPAETPPTGQAAETLTTDQPAETLTTSQLAEATAAGQHRAGATTAGQVPDGGVGAGSNPPLRMAAPPMPLHVPPADPAIRADARRRVGTWFARLGLALVAAIVLGLVGVALVMWQATYPTPVPSSSPTSVADLTGDPFTSPTIGASTEPQSPATPTGSEAPAAATNVP